VLLSLVVGVGVGVGWSTVAAGLDESPDPEDRAGREPVVLAGAAERHSAPDASDIRARASAEVPGVRHHLMGTSERGRTLRRARAVLHTWDDARAAAYRRGSLAHLGDLYVGRAGTADVRVLRSYLRRGYVVEDLRMQLLEVRVLDHRAGEWRLEVTDRLAGGTAVGYGDRLALPRDRASTRTIVLRRGGDGRWRAAAVRG
jgi:hypothetical protein